ncbi:glycoside hydrolase family 2 protein [Pseudonocardia acaciae]|uniref:glycoside hydrolase family 2 protein n=1 Tax=Pseudonocardia acaciae TaxID=551276 RepID=UPI0004900392|nr:sugar-binding domain-containing protein [Pseudonocardia acaciae]
MTHPRPQLTRPDRIDLCGSWGFAYDDNDEGLDAGWFERAEPFDRTIVVPFPPESKASGIGDTGYHPVVWYRRTFRADPGEGRLVLHLGAVDYRARVWLNGRLVATHEGGHTPFHADVTAALGTGEQVLVVRAEDSPTDPEQPRGKQDWRPEPHTIWYHRTTGIWQPVWAETVPARHIRALRWTTSVARGQVELDAELAGPAVAARLEVRLRLGEETLAEQSVSVRGGGARLVLDLPAAHHGQDLDRLLWTPERPTLLDAELTLATGDEVDTVASYVGLREVGVRDGRFTLNGRPYFPRMVLEQGYWPSSHLAAPGDDALRREVELIKSLGFNGARLHQKVEDPRFLHWCDRLGLLVWDEMPAAYAFSPTSVARLCAEWAEVVRRDAGHPCVVAWVPLNESWGVQDIRATPAQRDLASALYHLTRALDPTRPVISNDGWEHTVSDIYGVHDYAPTAPGLAERYRDEAALADVLAGAGPAGRQILLGPRVPGTPVMVTEFGGLSYTPKAGEKWHGYATLPDAQALARRYAELTGALLESTALAGFCYTQLTDTLQESNGLLTAEREPKIDPAVIRAANLRPSAAIPGEELAQAYREALDR